jgi:hypothetical protein
MKRPWTDWAQLIASILVLLALVVGFTLWAIDFDPSTAADCRGPLDNLCLEDRAP